QQFKIERSVGVDGNFTFLDTVPVGTTTYADRNQITTGTAYYYRVKSSSAAGVDSLPSPEASATVPTDVPAAPSGLTATVQSPTQVGLSWTRNSNNEDGFKVERAPAVGGPFVQIGAACKGSLSYPDMTVSQENAYNYRVKAYNSLGDSAYALVGTAYTPPAAPVLSISSFTRNSITLGWTESAPSVDSYGLVISTPDNLHYTTVITISGGAASYTVQNLAASTPYYFKLEAVSNTFGPSAYSNEVNATTGAPPPTCQVTTFSGSGTYAYVEGVGTAAAWENPYGVTMAIDPVSGNHALFICDTDNQRIRMVYLDGPNAGLSILIAGNGTNGYGGGGAT